MRNLKQPSQVKVKALKTENAQNTNKLTSLYFVSALIVGVFAVFILPNL